MNTALSTVGFYPNGGAGIQADWKTISVNGVPARSLPFWQDTAGVNKSIPYFSRYVFTKI